MLKRYSVHSHMPFNDTLVKFLFEYTFKKVVRIFKFWIQDYQIPFLLTWDYMWREFSKRHRSCSFCWAGTLVMYVCMCVCEQNISETKDPCMIIFCGNCTSDPRKKWFVSILLIYATRKSYMGCPTTPLHLTLRGRIPCHSYFEGLYFVKDLGHISWLK